LLEVYQLTFLLWRPAIRFGF